MDVPEDLLQNLKCSKCSAYLSVGPIYIQFNGTAICGYCSSTQTEQTGIRNRQYEALACLLRFPCKNRKLGCKHSYSFIPHTDEVTHDFVCEYRQYVCPLFNTDVCEWSGTKKEIVQHCQEKHSNSVLDNSSDLTHDITVSNLKNYLITAFELLFILHVNVCITTGKIFHSIRLIGSFDKARNFNYNVTIKRNDEIISKKGKVRSYRYMAIQESEFLSLNINSLLDVLGGWDNTVFTITVNNNSETCLKCKSQTALICHNTKGWLCDKCVPKDPCEKVHLGCKFTDFRGKIHKHEANFCEFYTKCTICDKKITTTSLSDHYMSECTIEKYNFLFGYVNLNRDRNWQNFYIWSTIGRVMCWAKHTDTEFFLEIHSSISGKDLHKYKCEVRFSERISEFVGIFIPDVSYTTDYDWKVTVKNEDIPSVCEYFNVYVDITKKEDL